MAEFILNPRRAPRAPARCRAVVSSPGGAFEAETEDIGSHGCQLVAPRLVKKGDAVELTVTNERVPGALRITGRVAWTSPQAPWRVGIAFAEGCIEESARWFDRLIASYPGLKFARRLPDRIPTDATVYLGHPPKFLLDFTPEEAIVLRAIGSGARLDELQPRLRDRWPQAQRAFFSLLARQAVTLSRGQAVHPDAWKKILTDVEASLAVESLGRNGADAEPTPAAVPIATPPPTAPAAAAVLPPRRPAPAASAAPPASPVRRRQEPPAASPWDSQPVQIPHPMLDLPDDEPPLEIDSNRAAAHSEGRGAARALDGGGWGQPERRTATPAPDFEGAGVGWRKGPRGRSPEAQTAYEQALALLASGQVNGAIALLRKALSMSPGDPDIAEALGKLAFKDRLPGR